MLIDLSIPTCDTEDMIVLRILFFPKTSHTHLPSLCPMLQQLKLPNGPNSVTLTYDGLGLRVEGAVDVEQKGKLSFIDIGNGGLWDAHVMLFLAK